MRLPRGASAAEFAAALAEWQRIAVDANGIPSAGRYGIWPRQLGGMER
jgi:hypothetical protein